jgi:hypothetical protein
MQKTFSYRILLLGSYDSGKTGFLLRKIGLHNYDLYQIEIGL